MGKIALNYYRKKPLLVEARGPIERAERVKTANGVVIAHPGCFILRNPETGDTWPITPEILAETYEPIKDGEEVTHA